MRPFERIFPLLFIIAFCLFLSGEIRADSLVITSGSLTGVAGGPFSFSIAGQGLAFSGGGSMTDGFVDPFNTCLGGTCHAGQTLTLNSSLSPGAGPAIVGGVNYSNLYYEGLLRFVTGPIVIPAATSDADLIITATFTLDPHNVQGCTNDPFANGCQTPWVFSTTLSGEGIATLQLTLLRTDNGIRFYGFKSLTYTFQPAAVPEPTSLVLLGTGVTGLAAGVRRRRKHRAS